ncbi:hypothetical protein BaRGS_00040013 [Batillaria attramentaria]|uniref:Uncharacterized protein n=1 Tax=Batillaria attramentaria TaxID=370345 RepID=A0ABD0J1Q3_9CAEN
MVIDDVAEASDVVSSVVTETQDVDVSELPEVDVAELKEDDDVADEGRVAEELSGEDAAELKCGGYDASLNGEILVSVELSGVVFAEVKVGDLVLGNVLVELPTVDVAELTDDVTNAVFVEDILEVRKQPKQSGQQPEIES